MTDAQTFAALGGLITAVVGAIVAIYKLGPDRSSIIVKSAEVSVRIADTARDNLQEDVEALRAELAERRREEAQYRQDVEARLAELSAQVRAEKAEKEHVKAENALLRMRVQSLEDEVARLKEGAA
jgi:septal ring factor EnvC (AmiA/AmiB activator)